MLTEENGAETSIKNFCIENSMNKLPKSDIIFICVQSGQTGGLLKDLSALCHEYTIVIILQNGLDFESDIVQSVPNNTVYSGTCWIKVSKLSENQVRHDFGNLLKLGPVSKKAGDAVAVIDFFKKTNLKLELTNNVTSVQLTKLALNVPFFVLMAKEGRTIREILIDQSLDSKRMMLQQEIVTASKTIHAPIDEIFINEMILNLRKIKSIPPNSREDLCNIVKKELAQHAGGLIKFFADRNIELNRLKKEYSGIFEGITEC